VRKTKVRRHKRRRKTGGVAVVKQHTRRLKETGDPESKAHFRSIHESKELEELTPEEQEEAISSLQEELAKAREQFIIEYLTGERKLERPDLLSKEYEEMFLKFAEFGLTEKGDKKRLRELKEMSEEELKEYANRTSIPLLYGMKKFNKMDKDELIEAINLNLRSILTSARFESKKRFWE
jgi:hypothetical protein